MTETEILALDGLALTEMAHRYNLAPENVLTLWDMETDAFRGCWYHNYHGEPLDAWQPHENLAQADALFRSLRTHPWAVLETLTASCAEGGWCEVGPYGGLYTPRIYWGIAWEAYCARQGRVWEKTEALALVRVSVLAVLLLGGE